MADLLQLDAAAALVGKSEITLRRLIKAGKIPVHKEKTLTGFIYMVNPADVRAYYGKAAASAPAATEPEREPEREEPTRPSGRRLAVAGESGNETEYWQKRAETYEERYHSELQKHGQTREELGVWRGRAEHAQAMLMKMLPAPAEVSVPESKEPARAVKAESGNRVMTFMAVIMTLSFVVIVTGAIYYFLRHR